MFQPTLISELEDSSIGLRRYRQFLATLELLDLESLDINRRCDTGRPPKDRVVIARAFVAKAMRNFCAAAGKKAIIAPNPRRDKAKKERMALRPRHAGMLASPVLRSACSVLGTGGVRRVLTSGAWQEVS